MSHESFMQQFEDARGDVARIKAAMETPMRDELKKNGPDVELCEPMKRMQARVLLLKPDDIDGIELDLSDSHTALFALAEYWKGKHDKLNALARTHQPEAAQPASGEAVKRRPTVIHHMPDGDTRKLRVAVSDWKPDANTLELCVVVDDASQEQAQQPAQVVPDVDALAQFIRQVDGNHTMGAGALAEKICEWLAASQHGERAE